MITLIDNYDSFTYNLVHLLAGLGKEVKVYRNDEVTADQVIEEQPESIVLSPGPCSPDESGICLDVVDKCVKHSVPLLGVCLGHQAIAQYFGAKVVRAPVPVHGKTSEIFHNFNRIENPFIATRYHSLMVKDLPDCLEKTAWTEDGIIMGLSHKDYDIHGLQFHPESILTEKGAELVSSILSGQV